MYVNFETVTEQFISKKQHRQGRINVSAKKVEKEFLK
jgi:hypothetical protein